MWPMSRCTGVDNTRNDEGDPDSDAISVGDPVDIRMNNHTDSPRGTKRSIHEVEDEEEDGGDDDEPSADTRSLAFKVNTSTDGTVEQEDAVKYVRSYNPAGLG